MPNSLKYSGLSSFQSWSVANVLSCSWQHRIWIDIFLSTSLFWAFRADLRIKITRVISQQNRNNASYYRRILGDLARYRLKYIIFLAFFFWGGWGHRFFFYPFFIFISIWKKMDNVYFIHFYMDNSRWINFRIFR